MVSEIVGGVSENVLIGILLDLDEKVHQSHLCGVNAFATVHSLGAEQVVLVLVADVKETNFRLDNPRLALLLSAPGGDAEGEFFGIRDLV